MAAGTFAYTPLGHEVEDSAFTLGISRIPVLHRGIFHLCILLHHYLHHGCMELVLIPHRRRASFHIAHIRPLVCHYQSPLELSCTFCIDSEITRKFHRTADPFGDVAERPVTEHCRVEGRIEIVPYGHNRSQIFPHEIRMLLHCLRKRAEYYPLVCQGLAESRRNRDRIKDGIHRHTRKRGPLVERDSEFLERGLELGIYLLRPVAVLLRCSIVYYILKIYLRDIEMRPCRHFHLLPSAESLQPELQKPFRFILLCRNQPDYILVQSLGNELLLHIRHEPVLIFLSGYVLQYVFLCLLVHNKSIELASALQWQTARICKYSSFFTFGYFWRYAELPEDNRQDICGTDFLPFADTRRPYRR